MKEHALEIPCMRLAHIPQLPAVGQPTQHGQADMRSEDLSAFLQEAEDVGDGNSSSHSTPDFSDFTVVSRKKGHHKPYKPTNFQITSDILERTQEAVTKALAPLKVSISEPPRGPEAESKTAPCWASHPSNTTADVTSNGRTR